MGTYDTEAGKIKRQRAIADALRASGNEALPASIQTGGRFDAPVSGYQYANKALQQVLGAYFAHDADKSEAKLSQKDKSVLADIISAKRVSDTTDREAALNGPVDSNDEMAPVQPLPKYDRKAALQAAVMRGEEFGGSSAPYAAEMTQREILPAIKPDFTLDANDKRIDGQTGGTIATGVPTSGSTPEDRMLVNIVDAKNPKGFRTILRSSFKEGEDQLYERPNQGATIAANFSKDGKELAAQIYRQTGKLPAGFSKSPQALMDIINLASQQAAAEGDTMGTAALRMQYNKAGQSALAQLTKQQVAVGNYEKTAMNSLKIAQDLSHKVDRMGVPVADRWLQAGMKNIIGDVDVARFHTANETFVTEYAKIMSGSMGNTPVSDATRQHARELIMTAMTAEQYDGVIQTLKQEMAGRIASFPAQIAELYGQLSATGDMPGAVPAAPPATAPAEAPVTKVIGGKTYVKTAAGWEEQ